MTQRIFEAHEDVLSQLFGDNYVFRMPYYQRPYSWTRDQAGELLADLLKAMENEPNADPYFLGSIVLIHNPERSLYDVIDGQQRLTTLTILLCLLREMTDDGANRENLDKRIRERADTYANTKERFRLDLREKDKEFFRDNIQEPGGIGRLLAKGSRQLSDSRRLLFENTEFLYKGLDKIGEEERDKLARFVISKCYLVVVKAYDHDSAHRVFSVLNARGLDLIPTDILKAQVIGEIPDRNKDRYTQTWENLEDELSREKFLELFGHIYVIETGNRFHVELAKAFSEDVLARHSGSRFIDETLARYSQAFHIVTTAAYENSRRAEEINRILRYLNRLEPDEWIPPAMVFLDSYQDDPDTLLNLFKALDCLAYGMLLKGDSRDPRISRYRDALAEAKKSQRDSNKILNQLRLTDKEEADVITALNGTIYGSHPLARFVRPLLLRLDGALADAAATYSHTTTTVEHVLPQSPEQDSEWVRNFPDEDIRLEWTNRLANLVLLSRSKNSRAQNYDFDRKKREYFQKNGVTGFALTTQVISENSWTPRVLERRQKALVEALKKEWGISSGKRNSK